MGAVVRESQMRPSDIPAAACLLKPVVFRACENSGWPRNPTSLLPPHLPTPPLTPHRRTEPGVTHVRSAGHCLVFVEDKKSRENPFAASNGVTRGQEDDDEGQGLRRRRKKGEKEDAE